MFTSLWYTGCGKKKKEREKKGGFIAWGSDGHNRLFVKSWRLLSPVSLQDLKKSENGLYLTFSASQFSLSPTLFFLPSILNTHTCTHTYHMHTIHTHTHKQADTQNEHPKVSIPYLNRKLWQRFEGAHAAADQVQLDSRVIYGGWGPPSAVERSVPVRHIDKKHHSASHDGVAFAPTQSQVPDLFKTPAEVYVPIKLK